MVKGKKAQTAIEQIGSLVVPLIMICIILVVGFLIYGGIKEQAIDLSTTNNVVNASLAVTFNTTWNVINYSCVNERDVSVTAVYNCSTFTGDACAAIDSGNYSIDGRTINITDGVSLGGDWKVISPIGITYSCQEHSYAINGTRQVQNATSSIPGWLPIIIITIIGAIIIGLVSMFRGRK